MCSLSHLKIGEKAVLKKIDEDLEIKKRLLDIGFTKGSMIECVMKSSFHGPVAFSIKNTLIALRECDSKKIEVEVTG